jgi:autotransporter-associated beta strand protein/YVTN family beta-propeller protein
VTSRRFRPCLQVLEDRTVPSASVIATIPVGQAPQGLAVNPGTQRTYVANTTDGTVSVISDQTNSVVATINLGAGSHPDGVGVNTTTDHVFVVETNNDGSNGALAVIDGLPGSPTENMVIATIPIPGRFLGARQIAVNPVTNRVYIPSFDPGGQVEVIDGSTNTLLTSISVQPNPIAAAVDPTTNTIYIGHGSFFHRSQITLINGATNAVSNGPVVGLSQAGLAVDPATHRLYVHVGDTSRGTPVGVVVVDTTNNSVLTTIAPSTTGQNSGFGNVTVNTQINRVYVAEQDPAANDVAIINGAPGGPTTDTQAATVAVGFQPLGVGVDTTSGLIYVSNPGSNTVSVIADIPDHVYVSNSFANPVLGQDPDGTGPATDFGFDFFATIQAGVNAVASGGTVTVYAGTYPEAVNINRSETVQINGSDAVTVNSLAGVAAATVDLSSGALTVGDATSATYSGSIIGSGSLGKIGSGTEILAGSSTYSGATTVSAGTLQVDGSIVSNITVSGTLDGIGTTGNVTSTGGTVAPGHSPGILTTSSLSLDSSSAFNIAIGGNSAGNGAGHYSQDNVTSGTVSLGGATLNLSAASYTPQAGDVYLIINNGSAVGGTFNGLPEGALISTHFLGTNLFATITYKAGNNQDSVAIDVTTPPTVVGTQIDDGTGQRSMVRSITLTFNGNVSSTLPFIMHNLTLIRTDSLNVPLNGTLDSSGTVLTLTFSGSSIVGGSLADGRYNLSFFNNPLLKAGQAGNNDEMKYLWRLFGDLGGQATVNAADQKAFLAALNSKRGQSNYLSCFDYDENGIIVNNDLTQFRMRFGTFI